MNLIAVKVHPAKISRLPFSRWREKVPKADEGGANVGEIACPGATLTRRALRADLSRRRER